MLRREAWFRLDAFREGDWGSPIVSKLESETSGDWALLAIGDDLVFRFFPADGSTLVEVRAPDSLTLGAWIHAAAVFDRAASVVVLYRDGAPVTAVPNLLDVADTPALLRVGPAPTLPAGSFVGAIDEIRVWTSARAAEDIAADRARPLAGTEQGLAAYWAFDDVDVGIAQPSRSLGPAGGELALGRGASAPLAWTSSPLETPGCPAPVESRLFFSQRTLASGESAASLEIFNASDESVSLVDYEILVYPVWSGAPAAPASVDLPELDLDPNAAFVVCGPGEDTTGCDFESNLLFAAKRHFSSFLSLGGRPSGFRAGKLRRDLVCGRVRALRASGLLPGWRFTRRCLGPRGERGGVGGGQLLPAISGPADRRHRMDIGALRAAYCAGR